MKITGDGVRMGSSIYFYTPSENSRNNLFYPIAAGSFFCDKNYKVNRIKYDSFLVLLVLEGEIALELNDTYVASKNEALIIDCYEPHAYYTYGDKTASTLWLHFDGQDARKWYKDIISQKGHKIKCGLDISNYMLGVINCNETISNEYDFSRNIYSLLCELAKPDEKDEGNERFKELSIAKEYIKDHFNEDLSVEKIASSINLSSSYFSKIFKETFSYSPYDYLLNVRLEKAKELLKSTTLSVLEIAYKTGFKSDANFIYFFKKETGISPLKFRNMKF